jgi:hypothetical protein
VVVVFVSAWDAGRLQGTACTGQERDREVSCSCSWTGASGQVGAPPDTSARGAVISDLGFLVLLFPPVQIWHRLFSFLCFWRDLGATQMAAALVICLFGN